MESSLRRRQWLISIRQRIMIDEKRNRRGTLMKPNFPRVRDLEFSAQDGNPVLRRRKRPPKEKLQVAGPKDGGSPYTE